MTAWLGSWVDRSKAGGPGQTVRIWLRALEVSWPLANSLLWSIPVSPRGLQGRGPLKSVPWAARSKSSHLLTDGKYGGCDSPELEALRFGRQPSCFYIPLTMRYL